MSEQPYQDPGLTPPRYGPEPSMKVHFAILGQCPRCRGPLCMDCVKAMTQFQAKPGLFYSKCEKHR